jgi:hypothetical protein
MRALLTLLGTRPQLLVDHAQGYAALFREDLSLACAYWQRWTMLRAVALCSIGVAVVLSGVALMLWAVSPALQIHAFWALLAVPSVPLLMALGCYYLAQREPPAASFDNLSRQLSMDLALLRAANPP